MPNKSDLSILFENIIIHFFTMNAQKYGLTVLFSVVVIGALAYGGWMYFNKPQDTKNTQTSAVVNTKTTATETTINTAKKPVLADAGNGKKQYTNAAHGFTVEIPNDWVVDETGSICGLDFAKTNTVGFRSSVSQATLEKEKTDHEQGKREFAPCYDSSPNALSVQWYATAQDLPTNGKSTTLAEWVSAEKAQVEQDQRATSTIQKVGTYTTYSYFSNSIDAADEKVVVDTEKGIFVFTNENHSDDEKDVIERAIIESFRIQ